MAMQAGIGLSKLIVLVGAGFTGSIVLRNGRFSDILGDIQTMVKGLNKSKGDAADSGYADDLSKQVLRLANEVRQLGSARPVTILNGNSSNAGDITSLIVPAAAIGTLGYGYMWWKGISFSDLMYVTKRSMATAVSGMTKHLEQVSTALAAAKRHLTQRIENLDGKLDEQKAISEDVRSELIGARDKLTNIGYDLNNLQDLVFGLNFACAGVLYLCQFVEGKDGKFAELLQDGQKFTNKHGFLGRAESKSLKGLQHIVEAIESGEFNTSKTEILPTEIDSSNQPRPSPGLLQPSCDVNFVNVNTTREH